MHRETGYQLMKLAMFLHGWSVGHEIGKEKGMNV